MIDTFIFDTWIVAAIYNLAIDAFWFNNINMGNILKLFANKTCGILIVKLTQSWWEIIYFFKDLYIS